MESSKKVRSGKKRSVFLRTVLIILGVLLALCIAAVAAVLIKLGGLNRGAADIVPNLNTPEPVTTPSVTLVPVTDPDDLDLSEDYEPDIAPGDITDDPIFQTAQKDPNVINIFILGNDARDANDHGRTDSMMLLSYNKKTRRASLVSFLRDTWIYIPGRSTWNRINTAYRFGGIGLAINTINTNFDLDIQYYMRVDFNALREITDALGGIDIELTQKEVEYINLSSSTKLPERAGVHHLNGEQTLIHARNRKIGNGDWSRTERQRSVMTAFFNRAKQERDAGSLISLVNQLSENVETNLSPIQLCSLAVDVIFGGGLDLQSRALPFEGTWDYAWESGMAVIHIDIEKNKQLLHSYIYGG